MQWDEIFQAQYGYITILVFNRQHGFQEHIVPENP